MDPLEHLRRELTLFQANLQNDLTLPVEHCRPWTLHDLADHLGRGNLWVVAAVTEHRGDHRAPPAPSGAAELRTWFARTCEQLLTVLEADPGAEAWTFFPPHTVGFWRRRRALETLVHRWDAEHAAGGVPVLDPALADDGVAEVLDTMVPLQVGRGRMTPPQHAVRLAASDTGSTWVLGPGDPVATVSATAADLLLVLWGRLAVDDPAVTRDGDLDLAAEVLAAPLVP